MSTTFPWTVDKLLDEFVAQKINCDAEFFEELEKSNPTLLEKARKKHKTFDDLYRSIQADQAGRKLVQIAWEEKKAIREGEEVKQTSDLSHAEGLEVLRRIYGAKDEERDVAYNPMPAEILEKVELTPVRWIVQGILPAGLAMLCADPKVGKSWFALDLALSVATGEPFMDFPTVKETVLYYALEDSMNRTKKRINLVRQDRELKFPRNLLLIYKVKPTFITDLQHELLQSLLTGTIRLVIIDVFQMVRFDDSYNQSMYGKEYAELEPFKRIAEEHDCCILLIHHNNKSSDGNNKFNKFSGSTAIQGVLDTMLLIEKENHQSPQAKLLISGRDVLDQTYEVRFDKHKARWIRGASEEEAQRDEFVDSPLFCALDLMVSHESYTGTLAALIEQLSGISRDVERQNLTPLRMSLWLKNNREALKNEEIFVHVSKTNKGKLCSISKGVQTKETAPDLWEAPLAGEPVRENVQLGFASLDDCEEWEEDELPF